MEAGRFGLNGIVVKIVITKKYTLAARLNCMMRDRGAQVRRVYFVVRTLFESVRCSAGNDFSSPKKTSILAV